MPKYQYEIQTSNNQVATGILSAASLSEASDTLRAQGGFLLNITPADGGEDILSKMRNFRVESGPGLKDVMSFTKQLAVMIKAGISIRDAIDIIAEPVQNQKFKKILLQIKQDVESGMAFSAALARHPKVFSTLYVNMIRAAEISGTFSHMLERIGKYLNQQAETRSMVVGALVYPGVLATMSVTAVIFLLTWVLPKFLKIFAGKEALLPKPTKMLIAMSDFLRGEWYFLVAAGVLLVAGFVYAIGTPLGRKYWDSFKLRMPIFRRMFRAVYITRGLQTMGELINAGVPMLETLEITAEVSGNTLHKNLWMEVRSSVQEGNKIISPLSRTNLLPKSVVQMISAGEESGNLGEVLYDISDFYAKELKETIKAVTSLIEPLMIVLMGVVVGFIAMSIILPVFKMSSVVAQ